MESTITTAIRILRSSDQGSTVACTENKIVLMVERPETSAVRFDYCFPESESQPEQARELVMQTLGRQMIEDALTNSGVLFISYGAAHP
jgi:hypothetical protein